MLKDLPNNKTQHIYHDESVNQQKQKTKTLKTRNVWQDKGAAHNARAVPVQPDPLAKGPGAHALNTIEVRSQKGDPSRFKLVHQTLHIHPLVKAELARKSAETGESISAIGAQALYEWATSSVDRQHATTLRVELRQMFREELAAFGHRIVFFLLRIAFSAEQARILITNSLKVLLQMRGNFDEKTYFTMVDGSAKLAKKNIIRNTPQMKSLLEEWESAFASGEGEGKPR
jgi:hypothetical protein